MSFWLDFRLAGSTQHAGLVEGIHEKLHALICTWVVYERVDSLL